MTGIITLTTDFGTSDAYVAIMKGVILNIAPEATIVDVSHDIAPQAVSAGHFLLAGAYRYFPVGSIHVAVVDPGVGTSRRPVALTAGHWRFVGPDNGLFSFLWSAGPSSAVRAVHLTNRAFWLPETSATFHGRDIFAPVAAHLARGVHLDDLGPEIPLSSLVTLCAPEPTQRGNEWEAEILYVDRFGNLITNVPGARLRHPERLVLEIAAQRIGPLSHAYGDVGPGQLLALVGSTGYLEIAANQGNAARQLAAMVGTHLRILNGISAS